MKRRGKDTHIAPATNPKKAAPIVVCNFPASVALPIAAEGTSVLLSVICYVCRSMYLNSVVSEWWREGGIAGEKGRA